MIRSTCAVLFAFVLATVFVTSPQSSEAKDRRCRPQCCPQRVYCCPPATCCQPKCYVPCYPTTTEEFCAWWQWAEFPGYCSYYAVSCVNSSNATSLDAQCAPPSPPGGCWTGHVLCADLPVMLVRSGLRKKSTHVKPGTRLHHPLNPAEMPTLSQNPNFNVIQIEDFKYITLTVGNETIHAQLRRYLLDVDNRGLHAPAVGQEIVRNPGPATPFQNPRKTSQYSFTVDVGNVTYEVVTHHPVPNIP